MIWTNDVLKILKANPKKYRDLLEDTIYEGVL